MRSHDFRCKHVSSRLFIILLSVVLMLVFLPGCSADPVRYKSVAHVGSVPAGFERIIQDNAFYDITAFSDRLLKSERLSEDEDSHTVVHRVSMLDLYGEELAVYSVSTGDAYYVSTCTATEDGGFLFVLGFRYRTYDSETMASDKGFASRVIKCSASGEVQFDTPLEGVEGDALRYFFEENGCFYLFGTFQTPEAKRGVYSSTDILMTVIDSSGTIRQSKRIGGSDFDDLQNAEKVNDDFLLSVSSQSDDGNFEGSDSKGYGVSWTVRVNEALEITEKEKEPGRDPFDVRIGERAGKSIYISDPIFKGFNAGRPKAYIDYGDLYLVVSENITGIYEHKPLFVNATWYYTETVYSAYDHKGKLLFRTSVDSSPDYSKW